MTGGRGRRRVTGDWEDSSKGAYFKTLETMPLERRSFQKEEAGNRCSFSSGFRRTGRTGEAEADMCGKIKQFNSLSPSSHPFCAHLFAQIFAQNFGERCSEKKGRRKWCCGVAR